MGNTPINATDSTLRGRKGNGFSDDLHLLHQGLFIGPAQLANHVFSPGRLGTIGCHFAIHHHHRATAAGVTRTAGEVIVLVQATLGIGGDAGVETAIGTAQQVHPPSGFHRHGLSIELAVAPTLPHHRRFPFPELSMALKATVFKTELAVSDLDRHHYQTHRLTLARHPSETDERLMLRLLAFALHADEALQFTRGISSDDEPDLWQKDLTGHIQLWIDLGQPDEKRIRKACGRADRVLIYPYGGSRARIWWEGIRDSLERFDNLGIIHIPQEASAALEPLAERNMQLQCTIQDGSVWIGNDQTGINLEPEHWRKPHAG